MPVAAALVAELATRRRQGETFAHAWPPALAAALAAAPNRWERREWAEVLAGMVSIWRSAFAREPAPRRERALLALLDPDREPASGRECLRCGEEIPPERGRSGPPPRYCSDDCRRAAQLTRERHSRMAA